MPDVLTSKLTSNGSDTFLKLAGAINEGAVFPEIKPEGKLRIDFSEVTRINSRGIKIWCQWIGQFKAPLAVHYERCPSVVIKAFNLVKGCIPAIAQVDSFIVPLYSSATGERKDLLITRGKEYGPHPVNVPEQRDSKGNIMEVDVHETYWAFLNRP